MTTTEGRRIEAIFAIRLREAREAHGWRQQDLADRMSELGSPMDRTTLAKIEKGKREARLGEAVALAAALDVAPTYLYLPIEGPEPVCLAPKLQVDPAHARQWARGTKPLDPANLRVYSFQSPSGFLGNFEGASEADRAAVGETTLANIEAAGVPARLETGATKAKTTRKAPRRR
jgi:transcriptional regulator with XRE-family HTH domain